MPGLVPARLAYPEVLDRDDNPAFFYESDDGLTEISGYVLGILALYYVAVAYFAEDATFFKWAVCLFTTAKSPFTICELLRFRLRYWGMWMAIFG